MSFFDNLTKKINEGVGNFEKKVNEFSEQLNQIGQSGKKPVKSHTKAHVDQVESFKEMIQIEKDDFEDVTEYYRLMHEWELEGRFVKYTLSLRGKAEHGKHASILEFTQDAKHIGFQGNDLGYLGYSELDQTSDMIIMNEGGSTLCNLLQLKYDFIHDENHIVTTTKYLLTESDMKVLASQSTNVAFYVTKMQDDYIGIAFYPDFLCDFMRAWREVVCQGQEDPAQPVFESLIHAHEVGYICPLQVDFADGQGPYNVLFHSRKAEDAISLDHFIFIQTKPGTNVPQGCEVLLKHGEQILKSAVNESDATPEFTSFSFQFPNTLLQGLLSSEAKFEEVKVRVQLPNKQKEDLSIFFTKRFHILASMIADRIANECL